MRKIIALILGFVLATGLVSFSQECEAEWYEQYDWDAIGYSWEMAPWLTTVDEFKSIIYDNITHDVPKESISEGSGSIDEFDENGFLLNYEIFRYPYLSLRYDDNYTIYGKPAVYIRAEFVPDTGTGSYTTDYCGDYKLIEVTIGFDPDASMGTQYLYNTLANRISFKLGSPDTDKSGYGGYTIESSKWCLFYNAPVPIVTLSAHYLSDADDSVLLTYSYNNKRLLKEVSELTLK